MIGSRSDQTEPGAHGVRVIVDVVVIGTVALIAAVALSWPWPLHTFEEWLFRDSGGRGCYGVNCRFCDDPDFGCEVSQP